jgi:hypothetical protein
MRLGGEAMRHPREAGRSHALLSDAPVGCGGDQRFAQGRG